jgi:integrase
MKVSFSYGLLNKPEQKTQSIYIRVKHNTLQFKRTLNIPIDRELWNFKKKELVKGAYKGSETKQMYEHANFMLTAFENAINNEWSELRFQFGNKIPLTLDEWKNWCEKIIQKVNSPIDLIAETPNISQLWKRYIELKSDTGEHQKSTTKTWNARLKAYKLFEDQNKKYNTDELDMQFYAELRKYILRIRNPKDELSELRTLNYFGDFIKKIKALAEYYESEGFIFHKKVLSKEFKAVYKSPPHDILTPAELDKLWSYEGDKDEKNLQKLSRILYYGCLRVSGLKLNLKKGFNEIQNELTQDKDFYGNDILIWKAYQQKSKAVDTSKSIPVIDKQVEIMLTNEKEFPKYIHENEFNREIKLLVKKVGIDTKKITSHTFRRSILTNLLNANKYTLSELMRFSGHTREDTLRIYLKKSNISMPTKVRVDDRGNFM